MKLENILLQNTKKNVINFIEGKSSKISQKLKNHHQWRQIIKWFCFFGCKLCLGE